MGCEKCSNSAKKILDEMAENRWEDVVKLTDSACRMRAVTRVALLLMAFCFALSAFLFFEVKKHGAEIEALRGELKAVQEILSDGVVVESWTTTETTTNETIHQDTGEGSGNNVYLGGDNATYHQTEVPK